MLLLKITKLNVQSKRLIGILIDILNWYAKPKVVVYKYDFIT